MMMASRRRSVAVAPEPGAALARGAARNETALASTTPSDALTAISRCRGGERSAPRRGLRAPEGVIAAARRAALGGAEPTWSIAALTLAAALAAASASGVQSSVAS